MIIFVGDKPSPKMKPGAKAFQGAACEQRLMEWIKTLLGEGIELPRSYYHDIVNQCDVDDNYLTRWWRQGDMIIALGAIASKKCECIPHFRLPHPSGKNRQINDKEFIAKKLAECKQWLETV